jgi:hypothetical protein
MITFHSVALSQECYNVLGVDSIAIPVSLSQECYNVLGVDSIAIPVSVAIITVKFGELLRETKMLGLTDKVIHGRSDRSNNIEFPRYQQRGLFTGTMKKLPLILKMQLIYSGTILLYRNTATNMAIAAHDDGEEAHEHSSTPIPFHRPSSSGIYSCTRLHA